VVLALIVPYGLAGGEEIFLRGGKDPKVDWGRSISILPVPVPAPAALLSDPPPLTALDGLCVLVLPLEPERVLLMHFWPDSLLTDTGRGRGRGWDLLGGDLPGTPDCWERRERRERKEMGRGGRGEKEERRRGWKS
jgi:hypothetical protein